MLWKQGDHLPGKSGLYRIGYSRIPAVCHEAAGFMKGNYEII